MSFSRVGDDDRIGERVDHLLIAAALLAHALVAALDVEVRGDASDHRTGEHHDRRDLVQHLRREHGVDDDDTARRTGESAVLALHHPHAAAEGSENFRGVRFGPDRRRAAIVRARHRKRRPFVERNPGRRSRRRVGDDGRLRQRRHHPRMRALGDRQLERPVVEPDCDTSTSCCSDESNPRRHARRAPVAAMTWLSRNPAAASMSGASASADSSASWLRSLDGRVGRRKLIPSS